MNRVTVASIQRATAAHYGIPAEVMREPWPVGRYAKKNKFGVSRPRQVAMLLSLRLTEKSYPHIGRLFGGRNHATVYHAERAVQRRAADDAKLREDLRRITFELVRRGL